MQYDYNVDVLLSGRGAGVVDCIGTPNVLVVVASGGCTVVGCIFTADVGRSLYKLAVGTTTTFL